MKRKTREKQYRALENIAGDEEDIAGLGEETKTIVGERQIKMRTLERRGVGV